MFEMFKIFEIFKIISGGQSGADLGGILFALIYKIEHEVNTHRGFKPIRGKIPDNVKVNYVTNKLGVPGLIYRTEYNVKNSDITLIFIQKELNKTKGSRLTARYCLENGKPHIIIKVLKNINIGDNKGEEDEYICEYIDKNKNKKSVELKQILNYLYILREDKIKGKFEINKYIINIAGERYWNENKIVKILEKIFGEVKELNEVKES